MYGNANHAMSISTEYTNIKESTTDILDDLVESSGNYIAGRTSILKVHVLCNTLHIQHSWNEKNVEKQFWTVTSQTAIQEPV